MSNGDYLVLRIVAVVVFVFVLMLCTCIVRWSKIRNSDSIMNYAIIVVVGSIILLAAASIQAS